MRFGSFVCENYRRERSSVYEKVQVFRSEVEELFTIANLDPEHVPDKEQLQGFAEKLLSALGSDIVPRVIGISLHGATVYGGFYSVLWDRMMFGSLHEAVTLVHRCIPDLEE